MDAAAGRYTAVAVVLHWVIAAAIAVLIVAGHWMTGAITAPDAATKAQAFKVYQWHKALGLTVLLLMAVRLGWRLTHPAPALPEHMPVREKGLAHWTHAGLYLTLFLVPLSGWLMVSASPLGFPTMYFGLFEWPHLPGVAGVADKKALEGLAKAAHEALSWTVVALVALHFAGVAKHHLVDRDGLSKRMWFQRRSRQT